MGQQVSTGHWWIPIVRMAAAIALVVTGVTVPAIPASADSVPPAGFPETVTADGLPTVQHNGVAWAQAVVGSKVFVVGSFTKARPAGSALGVNEVARSNILAFDINTGVLDTSFAPVLDAQALTIAVSPDQKTIYVGGDFQKVNGLWRVRAAAFDVATGALKPWAPVMSTTVRALAVTSTAVFLGGDFQTVSSQARRFLAAVHPTTGAVLAFDPSPDAPVTALTMNYSKSKLVVAGRFLNIAGQAWYGMAALNPSTGAATAWAATSVVRNAGTKASLTSLMSTADGVYGTGYVFGTGGNFEGTFRADNETGAIIWLADCHGDHYSVFPQAGVVYTTSHAHYCGNLGGFPQTTPWTSYFSDALTNDVRGTLQKEIYANYFNFEGQPAPAQLNWFPTWLTGTATTSKQAAWSISGNDKYLVYAGEFIGLNGAAQQGLVRFVKKGFAPNKVAPNLNSGLKPSLISSRAGEVRVGWMATHDRDNEAITYRVYRNFTSLNNTPVHEVTANSLFWRRRDLSFVDRGLTPGSTQSYRIFAFDPLGNRVGGDTSTITVATSSTQDAYVNAILAQGPTHYFPMDDPAGTTLRDLAGSDNVKAGTSVTFGATGMHGQAATFNGTLQKPSATQVSQLGPDSFSIEAWFRTTSTAGGQILNYGSSAAGGSALMDRQVYIDGSGRLTFGVYPGRTGPVRTVTSVAGFNDGAWHHVVGTLGSEGMRLYVDGRFVGARADATSGRYYSGVWRIGGDNISSDWPNRPTNGYFTGTIDEVAIYPRPLTASQVNANFIASGRTSTQPAAPADAYGRAVYDLGPYLYWRLDDTSGTTALDSGRLINNGNASGGVTWGATGALKDGTGRAAQFDGSNDVVVASKGVGGGPTNFTAGLWFKTTTTRGGKLIGFGSAASGLSTSYDRHIYMQDDGRLVFGTYTGVENRVTTPSRLNDGVWHQVVATQSSAGMRLYVDGLLVGTNPQTAGERYDGYWRIGGDNTWGSTSRYLAGTLDEAMAFDRALTAQEVSSLFAKGSAAAAANQAPTADFAAVVRDLTVDVDGSASTDVDGSIAAYSWDFGDGATGAGATSSHTYTAAGTYTVTLTVTDSDGAEANEASSVTVTAPNVAPTASFTSSVAAQTLTVDGSGSSDPDGTIAQFQWDFGDGGSAMGATPQPHAYASAGTYDVTLTVTDDRGATDSVTKSVVIGAANSAPTAAFSASSSGLVVTVNGATSTDSDGSITSYEWDFGDGSSATGVTPAAHVYAAPGSYAITLKVTDDDGATDTETRSLTVSALLAEDVFARTVASGWGTANVGGSWSACNGTCTALYSVASGTGRVSVAASKGPEIYLGGVSATNIDAVVDVTIDRPATGAGTYVALVGRGGYREGYRGKVRLMPDGSLQLSVTRAIAGVETSLGSAAMPIGTYTAGETLKLRMQVQGTSPTTLRLRVWKSSLAEPSAWQVSTTDATETLQKAGTIGFWTYLSGTATNGPAIIGFDNLSASALE